MMKKLGPGLMLFALTGCLTACSAQCPPARPMEPPTVYLQEIEEPILHGRTNADLLDWALATRQALRLANSDKARLRLWVQEAGRP